MFPKRFSEKKARRILAQNETLLREVSRRCSLPEGCLKAVLYKEIQDMDWLDIPADALVRFYWLRRDLRRFLCRIGLCRSPRPRLRRGFLGKRDSSTGYAQIFAATAIRSARFALERGSFAPGELGLADGPLPSAEDEELLCRFWRRLRRDRAFNFTMAALTLLSAADERVGRTDVESFSPEELMQMFTRYNTTAPGITDYGRAVYQYYRSLS